MRVVIVASVATSGSVVLTERLPTLSGLVPSC